jgi:hypothetical protein
MVDSVAEVLVKGKGRPSAIPSAIPTPSFLQLLPTASR